MDEKPGGRGTLHAYAFVGEATRSSGSCTVAAVWRRLSDVHCCCHRPEYRERHLGQERPIGFGRTTSAQPLEYATFHRPCVRVSDKLWATRLLLPWTVETSRLRNTSNRKIRKIIIIIMSSHIAITIAIAIAITITIAITIYIAISIAITIAVAIAITIAIAIAIAPM